MLPEVFAPCFLPPGQLFPSPGGFFRALSGVEVPIRDFSASFLDVLMVFFLQTHNGVLRLNSSWILPLQLRRSRPLPDSKGFRTLFFLGRVARVGAVFV